MHNLYTISTIESIQWQKNWQIAWFAMLQALQSSTDVVDMFLSVAAQN